MACAWIPSSRKVQRAPGREAPTSASDARDIMAVARRGVIAVGLIIVLLSAASGAERIDMILIGHVVSSYNPVTLFLDPDPSVRYTLVPTTGYYSVPLGDEEAKRYVKQYFPRTYEGLLRYKFVMYSIPYIVPLTGKQISWLKAVVETGASCALTDQGGLRMDVQYADFWVSCGMSDLFANDAETVLHTGKVPYSKAIWHLKVDRDAPNQVLLPLVPLGLEQIPALGLFYVVPKEGSVTLAEAEAVGMFMDIPGSPMRAPWLLHYEYGKGATWTLCDNFVNPFWCGIYYGRVEGDLQTDVLMNIIWPSVGWELPADAALVHQMRIGFRDYIAKRLLQLGLIEFVDRFGADLAPAENLMAQADGAKAEAEELYLDQDYAESSARLSVAFDRLQKAAEVALKQKNKALMWVFIIEWTSVTGTLMVCGAVLYSLMVRRRYYRQVATTRMV